jgi:hypothetical protein
MAFLVSFHASPLMRATRSLHTRSKASNASSSLKRMPASSNGPMSSVTSANTDKKYRHCVETRCELWRCHERGKAGFPGIYGQYRDRLSRREASNWRRGGIRTGTLTTWSTNGFCRSVEIGTVKNTVIPFRAIPNLNKAQAISAYSAALTAGSIVSRQISKGGRSEPTRLLLKHHYEGGWSLWEQQLGIGKTYRLPQISESLMNSADQTLSGNPSDS